MPREFSIEKNCKKFRPSEEYFALRVHGDSMKNAGIQDKSIIICHKQETLIPLSKLINL